MNKTDSRAETLKKEIDSAEHILIVQAENPDGDSVATSLSLEALILDNFEKKKVTMFCILPAPAHLRYLDGYDRIVQDLPSDFDLVILVDCAEAVLLEKTLRLANSNRFNQVPVIVLDHHQDAVNLPFETINLIDTEAVSSGAALFSFAKELSLKVSIDTASFILASILSDTLGLSLDFVKPGDFRLVAELCELGASVAKIENARKELNKRPQFITKYKARLLSEVEYLLDGRLAYIKIPWEDIEKISGVYNPPMLVFEDMRLTEGVEVVVAVKCYKNGKFTAKIRTNPGFEVAGKVAARFGCGGHAGAAGCKVEPGLYTYEGFKRELIMYTEEELNKISRA